MIRFAVWLESLGNKFYIGTLVFFAFFCSGYGYIVVKYNDTPIWRAIVAMLLIYGVVLFVCVYAMLATKYNRTTH